MRKQNLLPAKMSTTCINSQTRSLLEYFKSLMNGLDYNFAKEILLERGEEIDLNMLTEMKNERLSHLAEPEKSKGYMIITGYIFSVLGGALGIAIGYALWNAKKTLPNGEIVWSHTDRDRQHGRIIFLIGITVLIILILLKITDTTLTN